MAGVKNGSGARREILPRPAASPPGRRRGLYAAAGGLAAVVIAAVALASNLGGKPGPGPAPAEGAPWRPPSVTGTYRLPAGTVSLVEGVPVSALITSAQAQLGRGQVTAPEKLPAAAPPLSSGGRPEIMFICAEYWSKRVNGQVVLTIQAEPQRRVVIGDGAVEIRHVHHPERHHLLGDSGQPEDPDVLLLRCRLLQQVPDPGHRRAGDQH